MSKLDVTDKYFRVLDHGFVCLKDSMGNDQSIEEMARVSYQGGTRKISDTEGLLRYLFRGKHTSPFERVEFVFHVGLPLFVARQWMRHRTFSYNEMSGRYSEMKTLYYTPSRERCVQQSKTNKQGGSWWEPINDYDGYLECIDHIRKTDTHHYKHCLENNLTRELARIDLPLSMYTYFICKVDLHNLFHFLSLRLNPHAQWEIRQYAEIMAGIVQQITPLAWNAFVDYQLDGCSMSRMERGLLTICFNRQLDPINKMSTVEKIAKDTYNMSNREIGEFFSKILEPHMSDYPLPSPLPANYFNETTT